LFLGWEDAVFLIVSLTHLMDGLWKQYFVFHILWGFYGVIGSNGVIRVSLLYIVSKLFLVRFYVGVGQRAAYWEVQAG
jgi:hypothetical protein